MLRAYIKSQETNKIADIGPISLGVGLERPMVSLAETAAQNPGPPRVAPIFLRAGTAAPPAVAAAQPPQPVAKAAAPAPVAAAVVAAAPTPQAVAVAQAAAPSPSL